MSNDNTPIIQLDQVGVRYRVPKERIPSIKEFAIRWIKREIGYETFWALQDIDLSLTQGEVLGIIGPNGAGKSTMLKVISRVIRPTRGRVRLNGRVAPLLELGAGFDFELTGRENIYLNGTILGATQEDVRRRMGQIIEFSGLEEFIDAPLRTYSTGMIARLGFSIATDVRPEILIVDEILGVGDADFQTRSFERIQSFQNDGTTIILVSHDLASVERMCSRAMWLERGKVVFKGSAKSVIDHYHRHTADEQSEQIGENWGPTEEQRWGSGKIEITAVRFVDEDGQPKYIYQTGEPLNIEMEFTAHEDVEQPVFGMAIHRHDGVHVTGPNSGVVKDRPDISKGSGKIQFTVPYLPTLEGLYHVSVAAVNKDDTEIFDYHDQAYPFRVDNRGVENVDAFGLMTMQGKWTYFD